MIIALIIALWVIALLMLSKWLTFDWSDCWRFFWSVNFLVVVGGGFILWSLVA